MVRKRGGPVRRRPTAFVVLFALTTATVAIAAFADPASAHQLSGSRFSAPIPLWLLFAGAGATVATTALVLATTDTAADRTTTRPAGAVGTGGPSTESTSGSRSGPRPESIGRMRSAGTADESVPVNADANNSFLAVSIPPTIATGLRYAASALFSGAVIVAIASGLFGTQVNAESLTTTFVWPVWVKGVGLYAIAFGTPWRVLSPWRTIYVGLCRLDGSTIALRAYPSWLGCWPALVGFVLWIGVLENLTIVPRSPRATAVLIAGYAIGMLVGALVFGPEWLRKADAFGVLYRLFGRVAPLYPQRRADGGYLVRVRPPWTNCERPVADTSLVAFVVATVYTVSFDGFTSTAAFQTILFAARDLLNIGSVVSVLLYLIGLLGFVVAFLLVGRAMGALAGSGTRGRGVSLSFAGTVLPIAAAYELAHNYPYVAANAGRFAALFGSALTGSSVAPIDPLGWLGIAAFWWSQVLLVVAGHVVAVIAAHRVALAVGETTSEARRLHAPLVALMIGYTVLSLWIVSQPVVTG